MQYLIAFGLYPGLLTTLGLTLLVIFVARLHAAGGGLTRGMLATVRGDGSVLILLGALLPIGAAALLPWPGSALGAVRRLDTLWLAWALLETSFVLALLPGGQSASPASVRAAMREAQLGAAGRVALWAALGVALWAGDSWTIKTAVGQSLALVAALVALPAAAGWGPFAPESSIAPAGAEGDLNRQVAELAQWGRAIRTTVLITLAAVVAVPRIPQVHWGVNLALVGLMIGAGAGIGRTLNGVSVRQPLLAGLRWCYAWALPLAVGAGVALVVGQRWL